jgi:hypothetical protein
LVIKDEDIQEALDAFSKSFFGLPVTVLPRAPL